jgi:hypothetical protein
MSNPKRNKHMRQRKRKGFIVKGITARHWWDRYDRDDIQSSRQRVKRDIQHHLKAWGLGQES